MMYISQKTSRLGRKISAKKIKTRTFTDSRAAVDAGELNPAGASDLNEVVFKDVIPSELLLTIILNERTLSTVSCSPANLIEFTVGYLMNNGYVDRFSDISLLRICGRELNRIIKQDDLSIQIEVKADLPSKNLVPGINEEAILQPDIPKFISSACGSIDDIMLYNKLEKIRSAARFDCKTILKLNTESASSQKLKKESGGLHSAALFDSSGKLIVIMEDIGRHNCIDKIAGFMQIKKTAPADKVIYTTGRISIDLIFKIAKMNVPLLVSNSSVTYSAALLAKKIQLTVVGYARGGRFNIYSYPKRIIAPCRFA